MFRNNLMQLRRLADRLSESAQDEAAYDAHVPTLEDVHAIQAYAVERAIAGRPLTELEIEHLHPGLRDAAKHACNPNISETVSPVVERQ